MIAAVAFDKDLSFEDSPPESPTASIVPSPGPTEGKEDDIGASSGERLHPAREVFLGLLALPLMGLL